MRAIHHLGVLGPGKPRAPNDLRQTAYTYPVIALGPRLYPTLEPGSRDLPTDKEQPDEERR
jgi:hypothetical protein